MRCRTGQLGAGALVLALALVMGGAPAPAARAQPGGQAEPAEPQAPQADAQRGEQLMEADRLTGACLTFQREQRELRSRLRDQVSVLDKRLRLLTEVAQVLEGSQADPASAQRWGEVIARAQQESSQILRWLRGEDLPEEPGLTRAALRLRLDELAVERRDAGLREHANTLVDPVERADLRDRVMDQARDLRERIAATTQPMREQLAQLDAYAAQQGEPFEQVMTTMGRLAEQGPVTVMAVRADGWFEHGLVSYRWTDRRGQLVASAQVRLLPRADTDQTPPLLLERFPILNQSEHEAEFHVGHFAVAFHTAVPELAGEAAVLQAAASMLDLDTLEKVQPTGAAPGQN